MLAMKYKHTIAATIGLLCLAVASRQASAQTCTVPSAADKYQVSAYIVKRFHLGTTETLSLLENGRVGDSCFWRLHFASSQNRSFVVFLSPDRKYLTTALYDMGVDPEEEERKQAISIESRLTAGSFPAQGPKDAKVTIVIFSDFECPYCKRMKDLLKAEINKRDPATIRVVYRYFPLSMHPWAMTAARIASCTESQHPDAFWKLHDYIFDSQRFLNINNVTNYLASYLSINASFDKSALDTCLLNETKDEVIARDTELGREAGVTGTPTLFINGYKLPSIKDANQLGSAIDAAMLGNNPLTATQIATAGPGSTVEANVASCAPAK